MSGSSGIWRPFPLIFILLLLGTDICVADSPFDDLPTHTVVIPARTLPSRYIPARYIPGRRLPARHLPAIHIPMRTTSFGVLPAVDIPASDLPAVDLPPVYLPAVVIPEVRLPEAKYEVPQYALVSIEKLRAYYEGFRSSPVPASDVAITALPPRVRDSLFRASYRYPCDALLTLFASADTDRSGTLSWSELALFQKRLYARFAYFSNSTALRPDEFLQKGGGDCDDWALLTAAFCQYWGWKAWVACFAGSSSVGHALCMVRAPGAVPSGYTYWKIEKATTLEGDTLPLGDYVPVDYDQVGILSAAVERNWSLKYFITPAKIYGADI